MSPDAESDERSEVASLYRTRTTLKRRTGRTKFENRTERRQVEVWMTVVVDFRLSD